MRKVPDLEGIFRHLFSKSRGEISVSVKRGIWKTGLCIEGVSKLLLYYSHDVSTDFTSKRQLIPLAAYAQDSNYDEAVVRLCDIAWGKIHVDQKHCEKFGGIDVIARIAAQYRLRVVSDSSVVSMN